MECLHISFATNIFNMPNASNIANFFSTFTESLVFMYGILIYDNSVVKG